MLIKLECDKFRKDSNGKPESFSFENGLNIIQGAENSKNSIGKSTLMLLIDFMLGGDDYTYHCNVPVKRLGNHTIHAYFKFDEKIYHYSRGTKNPEEVTFYNDTGEIEATISNSDYLKELKKHYKLSDDITFRKAVAPYLRIYQRETTNEKYPLNAAYRQPRVEAIEDFLKLLGKYSLISGLVNDINTLEDEIDAFKKSADHKYVVKITEKQREKNVKIISENEEKLKQLREQYTAGTFNKDYQQNKESLDLLTIIDTLKTTKSQYEAKINSIEKLVNRGTKDFEEDLVMLQQFFPGVNFKHLSEVEDFHKQLVTIFNEQSDSEKKKAQNSINALDKQIAEYEEKYKEMQHFETVPEVVFKEMIALETENKKLKQQVELYDGNVENIKSLKQNKEKLVADSASILKETQDSINEKMANLDFYKGIKQPPFLKLSTLDKYYFNIPNDEGTGSSQRALILFDLAVLSLSQLPLIAHDSIISKQIEDYSMQEIIKLYACIKDKQIFMVYDGNKTLDETADNIRKSAIRVELGPDEKSLFGIDFSK